MNSRWWPPLRPGSSRSRRRPLPTPPPINGYWHDEVTDACAFDPQCNANAAYRISEQGSDWYEWSTYRSGSYEAWLDVARAAAGRLSPVGVQGTVGAVLQIA